MASSKTSSSCSCESALAPSCTSLFFLSSSQARTAASASAPDVRVTSRSSQYSSDSWQICFRDQTRIGSSPPCGRVRFPLQNISPSNALSATTTLCCRRGGGAKSLKLYTGTSSPSGLTKFGFSALNLMTCSTLMRCCVVRCLGKRRLACCSFCFL